MTAINLHSIPHGALEIITALESAGFEAWLVGGCVRDLLLGRMPGDWDITTSALPEDVRKCFFHTVPTGLAHGTVTVLIGGIPYEVTTYRLESAYSDFRRPDSVSFVSELRQDLARRDFTVNALAWHPDRGLSDPFGGQNDLAQGIIRAVGQPEERFREDALRMLRAVRFSAQLDFEVEAGTLRALSSLAANIVYVSGERIAAELNKWLLSAHPNRWHLLRDSGLMFWILPELDRCFNVSQNHPWHVYNVGDHTLKAAASAPPVPAIRWTLLLHDLGKAETQTTDAAGVDHFHGHEVQSEALADAVLRRLKWSNEARRRVLHLIRYHDREVLPTEKAVRRAVFVIGEEFFQDWLTVRRGDMLAQNPEKAQPALAQLDEVGRVFEAVKAQAHCLSIGQLALSGKDLLAAGIPQGPEIGRILKALLEWVIEDPHRNNRKALLQRAEELI